MSTSGTSPELDPRLLQWLNLLLQEGSVSRAALHANVTQSAMSHALRQMRAHFGDPLLVRAGRGMRLSARAESLKQPLQQALRQLQEVVAPQPGFEPAAGAHAFRIAMPDYGDLVLAPALLGRLRRLAPQSTLHCVQPSDFDLLQAATQVDLLIGRYEQAPQSLHRRVLWDETFVVIASRRHPRWQADAITLDDYLAESHVLVSPTGVGLGPVDSWLQRQGRRRHVACTFTQFASAARQVAESELVCTLPRRVALGLSRHLALRCWEPPLPLPSHAVVMLWHAAQHRDPRHRWLRQQVVAALRGG
ncbi:LysR family transcriptional regulator [Pelomonas sp. BJYL3]|uniref:LysR family transcriptional regulator n=1 Tax=Pelomonas sp. BJYL3 TaxID=2976697 RepID=UPI0022B401E7|nr:LysR family transcriptional regulator [Pelomonas sp. BJYL3]